jgi:hypothetical protein
MLYSRIAVRESRIDCARAIRRCAYLQQIPFPMPLLCQTVRLGGLHKRFRKAFHVPVGHKQADRAVQVLLKCYRIVFQSFPKLVP